MSTSRFLSTYTRYLRDEIVPAWDRADDLFNTWCSDDFWADSSHLFSQRPRIKDDLFPEPVGERVVGDHPSFAPVFEIETRVKWFDSVVEKINRPDQAFPNGFKTSSLRQIHDVLGARVIVYLPAQLRWVDSVIRSSDALEMRPGRKPKSYLDQDTLRRIGLRPSSFEVNRRKATGYASLHYLVRLSESYAPDLASRPWFELQVRTAAENLWGEIEHHLGYKPRMDTQFSVRRQFRVISDHLKAIDLHLDFIFQELEHLQGSSDAKDDDPLNAENIPRLLSGAGIKLPQHDLGAISEILYSYEIKSVGELKNLLEFNLLEGIRDAWMESSGNSPPTAVQVAHVLATLRGRKPTDEELTRRVRAFVEYETAAKRT